MCGKDVEKIGREDSWTGEYFDPYLRSIQPTWTTSNFMFQWIFMFGFLFCDLMIFLIQVLNHLLYLMRVAEKGVQRRVALALAHLCSPDDQRTIFIDGGGMLHYQIYFLVILGSCCHAFVLI